MSPGKLIIRMYSMGVCDTLGMNNQDALSEDLESDAFLNSALQRFMSDLYMLQIWFVPCTLIRLITSRYYLSERGTKDRDEKRDE